MAKNHELPIIPKTPVPWTMRTITIDVPFGLTIKLRTNVPGRLSIGGGTRNFESQGLGATSASQVSRQQSAEISISVPPSSPEDTSRNDMVPNRLERSDSRASQSTEPAYNDEWNSEEWIPYFQDQGIKIRDFAIEPLPSQEKVVEVFDPCIALLKYERMVKMRTREITRLFYIQWLTEEQARSRLSPEEWVALEDKQALSYPWTHLKIEKPTGTRDEVVASLRHHLKRTYPRQDSQELLDEYNSEIEFDGNDLSTDYNERLPEYPKPTSITFSSDGCGAEDTDTHMTEASNDAMYVSRGVVKRLHMGDQSHKPLMAGIPHSKCKRQKLSPVDSDSSPIRGGHYPRHSVDDSTYSGGLNTGTNFSSPGTGYYPTPSHSPSPSPPSPLPSPSAIPSPINGSHLVSTPVRSRGLARSRTLRSI